VRSGARRLRRRSRRFVGRFLVVALLIGGAFAVVTLYRHGYIRPNNPSLQDYPVRGVDVSSFQGTIDWPQLVSAGTLGFAFIKATEGAHTHDARFLQNWTATRGLIARAPYHFFSFCSGGDEQAQNFLRFLPDTGELPAGVDIEFAGNCQHRPSYAVIREQLKIFLNDVESVTRRKPIIYVNRTSYARIVVPAVDTRGDHRTARGLVPRAHLLAVRGERPRGRRGQADRPRRVRRHDERLRAAAPPWSPVTRSQMRRSSLFWNWNTRPSSSTTST